ncbi:flagellar basal body P-ring protein FlgI [Blastopirellula marina]|uniref:Flagellar biosynthesis protein FlgI n=1 Tax=Blastopirellula marina TaxID=124 RepID=A0A2S8F6N4_9BACT|nr:flagellar basal body P-ring protein FlgI [Blastopirellula marina]PQO27821.1 hypothetical protein C5Y98_26185 [Blastopirellula marina]PTL41556.1 hypothetical protein C5Y97_26200 [Blastopirellula marina]
MPRHGRSNTARIFVALILISGQLSTLGCIAPWTSKDPKTVEPSHDWETIDTVGDVTGVVGMNSATIRAITLITTLKGTGSDPPPGEARNMVLGEMRTRQIDNPSQWLASTNTAVVFAEAVIPPGAQKNDIVDVRVVVPPETDTTSLAGGWMPVTRLSDMAMLGGRMRKGHDIAIGAGPVVLDSVTDGTVTEANQKRGHVLGGARLLEERPLGLGLMKDHVSIATSSRVGSVINKRFYMFRDGSKKGVANPVSDKYIELAVHPRYKDNIARYMRVIRHIPMATSTPARLEYITEAEGLLLDQTTAQVGAMKLEAVGKEGVDSLKKGLDSDQELVRFCAAEALAYLNESESIEPLAEAARINNGFRYRALLALGSFDDLDVIDALEGLLNAESAEARYGAFDQLKKRSSELPSIAGTKLSNGVQLHAVRSAAPPMVHFRLKDRAEIAVFGTDVRVEGDVIFIGQDGLTIRSNGHRKLKVMRFSAGGEEEVRECSSDVVQLIRTLTDLDCQYGEIVRTLFGLRNEGYMSVRVEVNAMPRPDRSYIKSDEEEGKLDSSEMLADNFTQTGESAKTEESSEVSTSNTGDGTLIPAFD